MTEKYPSREVAEQELIDAGKLNPGKWVEHSHYVGEACRLIAQKCDTLDAEKAYILGLLHDIGRRIGFCGQKHVFAGYQYALKCGWEDVARISLTHMTTCCN